MLRHPWRIAVLAALALACAACGIKGPLYLPRADAPATVAPPAARPSVEPGPSSPPLPPTVTPPVERKS